MEQKWSILEHTDKIFHFFIHFAIIIYGVIFIHGFNKFFKLVSKKSRGGHAQIFWSILEHTDKIFHIFVHFDITIYNVISNHHFNKFFKLVSKKSRTSKTPFFGGGDFDIKYFYKKATELFRYFIKSRIGPEEPPSGGMDGYSRTFTIDPNIWVLYYYKKTPRWG